MHQFFIESSLEQPKLSLEQLHQCQKVLRLRATDIIRLVDQEGNAALVSLDFSKKEPLTILEKLPELETSLPEVTLCACLIRSERLEWMIQKATELGVTRIVLFDSSRTVMKIKESDVIKKMTRYQKIALEAAEQSQRRSVPLIEGVYKLSEVSHYFSQLNVVCYENATSHHFTKLIRPVSTTIIIGPEGGFSDLEIESLMSLGAECVTLGPRIYRAETASIYALSCISALLEG